MDIIIYKFVCPENHIKVIFEEEIKERTKINCHSCNFIHNIKDGGKQILKDELSHLLGD